MKGNWVYVLVYVDDILVVRALLNLINDMTILSDKFNMRDLGIAPKFLGIEIEYSNQSLILCQSDFIDACRFDLDGSIPANMAI